MQNEERVRPNRAASCAKCVVYQCFRSPESVGGYPGFCPHENYAEIRLQTAKDWSNNPTARKAFEVSDQVLRKGYGKWSRVREVIEYSRSMGYNRLGIAFCIALRKEAKVLHNMLEESGFKVVSICCMAGSPIRSDVGFDLVSGLPKTLCNPLMQAQVLNENETQLNIMLGLCMGHDVLFIKHSKADVTPLVVKDRVLNHNPAAALSSGKSIKSEIWRWILPYARRVNRSLRRIS